MENKERCVALYGGKHIVKREKVNDVPVETYIEFNDGEIRLNTYINYKLHSSALLAVVKETTEG